MIILKLGYRSVVQETELINSPGPLSNFYKSPFWRWRIWCWWC